MGRQSIRLQWNSFSNSQFPFFHIYSFLFWNSCLSSLRTANVSIMIMFINRKLSLGFCFHLVLLHQRNRAICGLKFQKGFLLTSAWILMQIVRMKRCWVGGVLRNCLTHSDIMTISWYLDRKKCKKECTWNESMPINQSGEGTIRVINDTKLWLLSTKNFASVRPAPVVMAGKLNSSKMLRSFRFLLLLLLPLLLLVL